MIAEVFKLLEQKRCDEIFNSPTPFFNSVVEDNFLKSYACILCKDSEVAVSYRNVLADFLSKTQSEILSKEHKLEAEAACLFLDAHILRLRMNFLGARKLIKDGLNMASEAGCYELVFRFMFLQCWMYHYCHHNDLALVYVERMEKYAKLFSLLTPFHTGLCRGLRLFIEHGSDDLKDMDMRAAYFVCEFSGGWLRPEGWSRNSALDYFRPIFGDSSCESVFDRAIGEISLSVSGFDAIREYHDKLTDNQRLICNFRIGRDINIYALDSDSFLLEPQNLASYLEKTQLSEEHRTLLAEKFNSFLHDASFQLNLEVYKPFVSEWFTQYHEQGIEAFCEFLGSRHVYDDIDDEELQCGPWTKDHAFRRVMDNMSMLLDLSEQNDSNVTLPVLTELIIRILLYRYYYYKSSSDFDNANTNRIAALIQLDEFNEFDGDSDKGSAYPYHLRSFPEVYHSVVRDIRNLSDSPVIFSVLLDQYVSKSNIINGLCKFWGEYDLDFNKYLKDKLESVFSEFSVGPGHEIKWLDNEKKVGRIHGDKVDIYFSVFSELGEWNAQFEKDIFNTWRCDESKDNISSPVTCLLEKYIKKGKRESIGLVVMMPGCYLVSSGPVWDSLSKGISLVSYNHICNSAQQYISFSKAKILSMGIDTRIVKDSSGLKWNLFSIYQIIGERSIDLRYTRDYDKLGLIHIIREFARNSGITAADVVYQAEIKGATYCGEIKGSVVSGIFKPCSLRFYKKSAFGKSSLSDLPNTFSIEDSEKSMVHTLHFSNHSARLDFVALVDVLGTVLKKEEIVDGLKDVKDNQIAKFLQAAIKPFAEKTAKTAIMARNMSHNLGSHVMFYIKQQLSSVNEMLRTKVFDQLFSDENDLLMLLSNPQEWLDNKYKGKGMEKEVPNIDNVALPFLVGLGRFMSYIQERQDFIASVATNFIPPASSLNFKDFIYDELNPDKRYMRHPDRLGDKPLNILLSYIARSENLGRQSTAVSDWSVASQENDIVIKFGDFDGDPVDEIRSVEYNPLSHYGNREAVEKASASLEQMRKLDFSIPSGVTGRHAFFSIIENLIRNSAKHGKFDNSIDKGSLKLTLNVYDKKTIGTAPDDDNYTTELSLREVFSRFYLNASDANDLYFVSVTDNLPTTYRNLQSIRMAIMEPYVDVDGRMLENFKGIKEMRICASWLRSSFNEYYPFPKDVQGNYYKDDNGCPPPDTEWTDIYTGNAPTLYVRLSNDHLQYIFAVQKTLNVLILSDCFDPEHDGFMEYDKLNRDVLKPNGWLGMCRSEYENLQKRPDYTFVLWDIASSEESDFNKIRSESNRRTYRISDVEGLDGNFVPGLLKNCNPQYLKDVYEILLRHMSSYHDGDWIFVDDEKAKARFESMHSGDSGVGNLVRFVDSDCSAKFVYRTHFETSSTKAFWQFFLAQKHRRDVSPDEYTEGVTGANSTDRLVRCDEINKEWFYRHLNIMKRSVAIFDERISDKLFSLSESFTADADNVRCRDHRPYIMSLKKVWAFNVVKDSDGLFIYGLQPNVLEKIQEYNVGSKNNFSLHSHCVKIAQIRADKGGFIVDFRPEAEPYKNSFDLISIHQGILDKLYDWLGIKHQNDRMELLTKALYDAFGRGTSVRLPLHDTHYLLPGMSIHSGRSLPSADDMPQHIPFIQFASLENAINDCKYSLVELMEHAYYDRH